MLVQCMNLKKMERYLRVNLLGPGPRLIKKQFTRPRSHKVWENIVFNISITIIMVFNKFSTVMFLDKFYVITDFTVFDIVIICKTDFLLTTCMCQRNRGFHTGHLFETFPVPATIKWLQEDLDLHLESQCTQHCSSFHAFTTDVTVVLQCVGYSDDSGHFRATCSTSILR